MHTKTKLDVIGECTLPSQFKMFSFGFDPELIDNDNGPTAIDLEADTDVNNAAPAVAPLFHELLELLGTLKDLPITFTHCLTPANNIVYKRELYDIKHQVMTEDNKEVNELLIDNNLSDLNKNSYEGGFKVWECSYDLIDHMASSNSIVSGDIIEVGSGTSLPSCYLLREKLIKGDKSPMTLVLSDFNYDVLRLVTLPNLIINWLTSKNGDVEGGEFRFDEELALQFMEDMKNFNITLKFILGGWSQQFIDMVKGYSFKLILSCETIYSLDSISILAKIIDELSSNTTTLIAAKNYYFGVGGSVNDFVKVIRRYGREVRVNEVNSQLKRSIIEIE